MIKTIQMQGARRVDSEAYSRYAAGRHEGQRALGILGGLLLKPALSRVSRRVDYEEYGGAPLLGVQGVCIVAHGRSNAKAIRSALRVARHAAENDLPEAIRMGIQAEVPEPVASGG